MAMTPPPASAAGRGALPAGTRWLRRLIDVRPDEVPALGWSWLYILAVLSSYYILRPIRDEMGVASGVEQLPWLFTGTLGAMVALNPAFAALVRALPRVRFIARAYRFFMVNLLVFVLLFSVVSEGGAVWVGRAFFIWTSVFNLFVVSIFWALMVDVFDPAQATRLFGVIAAGATVGGVLGSSVTAGLARRVGTRTLLLLSIVLLEVAVFGARRLSRWSDPMRQRQAERAGESRIGGGVLAGIAHAFRSPYLLGVGLYMLLYAMTSTVLYFEQATVVNRAFTSRAARTAFFAQVDLIVNVLTLATQLLLTGALLRVLGVAAVLTILPALSVLGFGALGAVPTVAVIVLFQVLRRAGNFAVARPAREVLFTVIPREDKYKTKSFIDTVVYRTGDQVGAWSYGALSFLGLGMPTIAWLAVPISGVWLLNGWWLGRRQAALARAREPAVPAALDSRGIRGDKVV